MAEVLFDYKEKPEADGLVTKFLDELTVAEQEQFLAFMQGFQFAKKSETVQTAQEMVLADRKVSNKYNQCSIDIQRGDFMNENMAAQKEAGKRIMDIIVMLLEDQNGEQYEYKEVDTSKDETAQGGRADGQALKMGRGKQLNEEI